MKLSLRLEHKNMKQESLEKQQLLFFMCVMILWDTQYEWKHSAHHCCVAMLQVRSFLKSFNRLWWVFDYRFTHSAPVQAESNQTLILYQLLIAHLWISAATWIVFFFFLINSKSDSYLQSSINHQCIIRKRYRLRFHSAVLSLKFIYGGGCQWTPHTQCVSSFYLRLRASYRRGLRRVQPIGGHRDDHKEEFMKTYRRWSGVLFCEPCCDPHRCRWISGGCFCAEEEPWG